MKLRSILSALALVAALAPCAVAQDLTMMLAPNYRSGGGQTLVFAGSLTNTLGFDADMKTLTVTIDGFDPSNITTLFDFASLLDGETRTTDLFSVYIPDGTPWGFYTGTATLGYLYGPSPQIEDMALDNFQFYVPESALIQLPALLGLGGLAWWRRRRT